MAVDAIERTLAQGHFNPRSDSTLKRMQEIIAEELTEPTLLTALRGERAGLHEYVRAMAEGKVTAAKYYAVGSTLGVLEALLGGRRPQRNLSTEIESRLAEQLSGYLNRQHADMLRFANDLVDAATLPPVEADERFRELESKIREEPYLVRITAPSFLMMREADRRMRANLRCAQAALASERYRLAHNDWPGSLDVLVKEGFLDAVPTDPYDHKPIRLKRTGDGLTLYSVGLDGIDNGGLVDRDKRLDSGTDQGFRLWDVSRRRQPPNPALLEERPPP
jgi:hypothetical protein